MVLLGLYDIMLFMEYHRFHVEVVDNLACMLVKVLGHTNITNHAVTAEDQLRDSPEISEINNSTKL